MQSISAPINTVYFYPRPPRGGRPDKRVCKGVILIISIHALREEGDQSRPAGRLRPQISIHALREEGDALFYEAKEMTIEFLSTPSARRATMTPL